MNDEVEIARLTENGAVFYSVRLVEHGRLSIKAHYGSLDEAKKIAGAEANRLGVEVKFSGFS